MKTVIKISLKNFPKIVVEEGAIIEKGDIIATNTNDVSEIEINLTETLRVKAKDIYKYLRKKPTEQILKNEVLAEKKSFVSTLSIKSPVSGRILHVDLNKGSV